jgi:putative two-component system response regulator
MTLDLDQRKYKILVAEDQPITRTLLEDILQDDYEVVNAANGQEALDMILEEKDIDLVLLDVIMPELNGFEVCLELKNNPISKDIPIIMLTIMDQEHNEAKGFEMGVADYITKPVSRVKLLTRVKNQFVLKNQQNMLKEKNLELQEAIDHIKTLRGILPICSFCNRSGMIRAIGSGLKSMLKVTPRHSLATVFALPV